MAKQWQTDRKNELQDNKRELKDACLRLQPITHVGPSICNRPTLQELRREMEQEKSAIRKEHEDDKNAKLKRTNLFSFKV